MSSTLCKSYAAPSDVDLPLCEVNGDLGGEFGQKLGREFDRELG